MAVTLDYETWQPVPPGRSISWSDDVLDPTQRLLDVCDETGARLTIMAEVAEYLWLQQHDPQVAAAIERQLREAIGRGHDVQLHLHVSWLPELGVAFEDGRFTWPQDYLRAADYEGDLDALIGRCKRALEAPLQSARPDYRVSCFRAGAYQVQPFRRLHDALVRNGIECDTSVFAGGVSSERGYDFRLAYSEHQPYFASPWDAQLRAPSDEGRIVELPVFTHERGRRWLMDGDEGPLLARRFLASRHARARRGKGRAGPAGLLARAADALWGGAGAAGSRRTNSLLPRAAAHALVQGSQAPLLERDYFVLIGHSKGDLRLPGIRASFLRLREEGVRFVTLADMARSARSDLSAGEARAVAESRRRAVALPGSDARARVIEAAVWKRAPWDRECLLHVSEGMASTAWLQSAMPWCRKATQVARAAGRPPAGSWAVAASPPALPWRDAVFDMLVVVGVLELQRAVERCLSELHRVLRAGGVLLAAIPSDARRPARGLPQHDWKTAPPDIEMRLTAARFVGIEIHEIDGYRELGLPPYPPADDRLCLVRAWKRPASATQLERATEIMGWVYRRLDPTRSQASNDIAEILSGGFAWCGGYNAVVARLLQREGVAVRWVTMEAEGHPRGRGPQGIDTHEVLEAVLDGRRCVLDSMTNRCLPHSLAELFARPQLATARPGPDARYRERGYNLYDTAFWYERVARYCLRDEPDREPCVLRPVPGRALPGARQGFTAT